MIWSISNHLNDSELNFNVQNGVRSISKFVGFLLNFRWYLDNHFNMQGLLLFFPRQVRRNCFMCRNKIKTIIATLSAGQQHNSTDHHSDQLKNSKFYKNSSEYANFSKSSGHCVYWIGMWRSPSRSFHFYMHYLHDLYNHQSFAKFTYIMRPPHVRQTLWSARALKNLKKHCANRYSWYT